jgi:hypothetical protein
MSYKTLREFYKLVCNEFNDGKPLEYKFTDPGGYWKMTKGFDGHGLKMIGASQYLKMVELCKRDVAKEHENEIRSRGRPKKVRNKYVGDLYE